MIHWFQVSDFFVFNMCSLVCKIFGHKHPAPGTEAYTFYFCPRCAKMFYWDRRRKER